MLEAARALIERIEIAPPSEPGGAPRIELLGHLSALLRAAGVEGVAGLQNDESPRRDACGLGLVLCSVSGDAGTGFEPVTFRL